MSTPPSPSAGNISYATSYGSGLVGSYITAALWGLTTTQTYLYYTNYPKDNRWTKALVLALWVLNTAHVIFVIHSIYFHLIVVGASEYWGNIWTLNASILAHVLIALIVMLFYVRRIFQLSNRKWRWWLTGVIMIPVLLHLAYGLDYTAHLFMSDSILQFPSFTPTLIRPFFILQAISDSFITITLCVLLFSKRGHFHRTRYIIKSLIIGAVSRGLVTLTAALVMVLAVSINISLQWYVGGSFTIAGLYTNSLMTMLNARSHTPKVGTEHSLGDSTVDSPFHVSTGGNRNVNAIYIGKRSTNVDAIELEAPRVSSSYSEDQLEQVKQQV